MGGGGGVSSREVKDDHLGQEAPPSRARHSPGARQTIAYSN